MEDINYIKFLGPSHLAYIVIVILSGWLLFKYKDQLQSYRHMMTPIILSISIIQQGLLYGTYLSEGFPLDEALPLHISRINTLIGLGFLLAPSRKWMPYLTYFSVFAWLSFIYPSRIEPITNLRGLSFLMNHLITIYMPFYANFAYKYSIKKGDWAIAWLGFIFYLIIAYIVNQKVNGNYFYMKYKPIIPNSPLWLYLIIAGIVTYLLFRIMEYLCLKLIKS